jgi:hypothetical protein
MNELVAGLGVVVAVAAAARSTWSPCGLSMLSTITPLAERGRGHRYGVTATWFVLGSTLGGATLGAVAAGLAAIARAGGVGPEVAAGAVAVLAVITAVSDLHPFGLQLPFHRRQVNELWLGRYRPWVYAGGFGWQIGVGLATYIMTAAVYLMVLVAALTASPATALAIVTGFGLIRGLAVLLTVRITTIDALHRFHRRFDGLAQPVRLGVIGVQFGVAAAAAAAAWATAPAAAIGVVGLLLIGLSARPRPGRTPSERAPSPSSEAAVEAASGGTQPA